MRRLRILLALLLLTGIVVALPAYLGRRKLTRQWRCYRVSAAESLKRAGEEIAWFESGPDRRHRLAELVGKWGTGNRRFDLHLVRYLHEPACSDALRESFSAEITRRRELLPRWAHYWSYRSPQQPDRQIESIIKHLDAMCAAGRSEQIPWREVLNLQAVFQLVGQPGLAQGLSPANWQQRYRRWQNGRPAKLPHVARPETPLADLRADPRRIGGQEIARPADCVIGIGDRGGRRSGRKRRSTRYPATLPAAARVAA